MQSEQTHGWLVDRRGRSIRPNRFDDFSNGRLLAQQIAHLPAFLSRFRVGFHCVGLGFRSRFQSGFRSGRRGFRGNDGNGGNPAGEWCGNGRNTLDIRRRGVRHRDDLHRHGAFKQRPAGRTIRTTGTTSRSKPIMAAWRVEVLKAKRLLKASRTVLPPKSVAGMPLADTMQKMRYLRPSLTTRPITCATAGTLT